MKHTRSLFLGMAATAAVLGLSSVSPAEAVAIRYNLNNVNLTAGNVTGYFDFDIDSVGSYYSNIAITVTGTSTYDTSYNLSDLSTSTTQRLSLLQGSGNTEKQLNLIFRDPLNSSPSQSSPVSDQSNVRYGNPLTSSDFVVEGGNVTAVPFETDVLPFLASTILFTGALWWKRKRAERKVETFLSSEVNGNPDLLKIL